MGKALASQSNLPKAVANLTDCSLLIYEDRGYREPREGLA